MIQLPVGQELVDQACNSPPVGRFPGPVTPDVGSDYGDDSREFHLFRSLDLERKGEITVSDLLDALLSVGLKTHDGMRL